MKNKSQHRALQKSENDLDQIETTLKLLPETHTTFNEFFSEIEFNTVLEHQHIHYPSVFGLYRTEEKSLSLFTEALAEEPLLSFCNSFEFTLLALIGQSLWMRDDVKIFWGKHFYPQFDQGAGTSPLVKMIDQTRLAEQIKFKNQSIFLDPHYVSLDESFAFLYACYVIDPQSIADHYPTAWSFFKDVLFTETSQSVQNSIQHFNHYRV